MSGEQGVPLGGVLEGLLAPGGTPPPLSITGIQSDSRLIGPGELFCAVPGEEEDGARYAPGAVARGAVAVLAARSLDGLGVPCLVATNMRRAVSLAAARFHGHPSHDLACLGVTGTNGKTTVCHLVTALLEGLGVTCGLLGTVGHTLGGERRAALTTTPGPVELQEMLRTLASGGARACVMEVSSHALVQERTAGVRWRAGVFTNLTRDHLDYHGTMENYGQAKKRLFAALEPGALAVVNLDDPWGERMTAELGAGVEVLSFAVGSGVKADLRLAEAEGDLDGTRLVLEQGGRRVRAHLPLVGSFNQENALAALAVAVGLGHSLEDVSGVLQEVRPAPGRLEPVHAGSATTPRVFVDYAHTPDALGRVLKALTPLCPGRLLVVFGCGGDRDRGKRPLMGAVAARLADRVWVTNDNPRSEDPEEIAAEVVGGTRNTGCRVEVILDREEAIATALAAGRSGDILVVAGKGHETVQIVGCERLPFDDREVVRRCLCRP